MTNHENGTMKPTIEDRLSAFEKRQISISERMDLMDTEIKINIRATNLNTGLTQEILDLFSDFKSGFRVLGWLGTGAKWLGGIAGAGVALWAAWQTLTHGGVPPK